MNINYENESAQINERLQKYRRDIELIYHESQNISKDLVKYTVQVLKEDNNPEVGTVIVELAFKKQVSMLTLLKCLVKILYVVKNIVKYKHGDYFKLKKYIDDALDSNGSVKAELAKKKYTLLLDKMLAEPLPEKSGKTTKPEAMNDLRDTINRQYIKFV